MQLLKAPVLLILLALASPTFSLAQSAPATADSSAWRDTGPKTKHGLARIQTTDGRSVRAYFPVNSIGFEKAIDYFRANPEVRPFPKLQYIEVSKLLTVTIRGHYHENMHAAGRPDVLALRLLEGPVELFVMSGTAADNMPLLMTMVPGVNLLASAAFLTGSAIERNLWFVRRNGQLVAVSRGGFRKQMSQYTADCPSLSTPIAQGATGFRYGDTAHIIQLYNEFLAGKELPK